MGMPSREQIAKDIYELRNVKFDKTLFHRKPTVNDDYYQNFITFLKNSFEYEHFHNEDLCVLDYINGFKNLKFFFNIIHKPNVFVVEQPMFHLYYLSDDNQLTTETTSLNEIDIYGFDDEFKKNRNKKNYILYMIRESGSIRFVGLDKDPRYLQLNVKERIKKERRLKLDKINEI